MKRKQPQPKFSVGEVVIVSNEELTIKEPPKWNGMTYMYAFENVIMRCGEDYLQRPNYSRKLIDQC